MQPIFMFEGMSSATITAPAGSATGFPVTNLNDDRYATRWKRGVGGGSVFLSFDFGTPRIIDSVLLAGMNVDDWGIAGMAIEVSSDGSTWSTFAGVSTFVDPLFVTGTQVTKRYVRFATGDSFDHAPEIGMVYVGRRVTLPVILNQPERGFETAVEVQESASGLRYGSSIRAGRERFSVSFALKSAALAEFFRLVIGVNGTLQPFWYRDVDGNWHFVRFSKDYMPFVGRANVSHLIRSVEMTEERVGTTLLLPGGYTV